MKQQLRFSASLRIMVGIIFLIFFSLFFLKAEPHLPLFISLIFLALIAKYIGYSWKEIEEGLVKGIAKGIVPIIILMLIGMLIAVWMVSGTIPTVLTYGFHLISPKHFLVSALLITTITSSLIGSSFTTVSTFGVALMGLGTVLGVQPELTAGAVICGACFGDKMSPLSDTTNFASGVASVELVSHIRHMMWTTIPSYLITAGIFFFLGNQTQTLAITNKDMEEALYILNEQFHLGPLTLLSPMLMMIMAIKRLPMIPILITGISTGALTAIFTQDGVTVPNLMNILQHGAKFETAHPAVDAILNRGGLQSMMWAVSLIMIALALGGLMEKIRLTQSLMDGLCRRIKKQGHLIASTITSSIGVNMITGEQYLSILLPGQTFKPLYDKLQIPLKNLSRSLEDGGTLVNPLVPWGVSGAFFASTLGIDVIDYLPYAFFLYLCPLFSIILGFVGIGMSKTEKFTHKEAIAAD
jgi:Na+:H+ antiporter, NhaC family